MRKTETIHASTTIKARPKAVYEAWIDADEHAAMTGAPAESDAREGGAFTAWDGYIRGRHLELQPSKRIVQSWRTSEFDDDDPDSRLVVILEPESGGTRITIVHTDIPKGQGPGYEQGWEEHYFAPMRRYFAKKKKR